MIAAALGHAKITDMLIEREADQNVCNNAGKTAVDFAANDRVRRTIALVR